MLAEDVDLALSSCKSVEEALKGACEAFKVGIGDLDFEMM